MSVVDRPRMPHSTLSYEELLEVFRPPADTTERIGIEVEYGLVNPRTGRSVSYDTPGGARDLVAALVDESGGEPMLDCSRLVGVVMADGQRFSLELGGALEYSSSPHASVAQLIRSTRRDVLLAAEVARRFDIALLAMGFLPFTRRRDIPWIPMDRVDIMRGYFRGLGPVGVGAEDVMGRTLSAQTTLDYLSTDDLSEKMRLLVLAAPIAAALFVNSPICGERPTAALSHRLLMWEKVDPARCGVVGFAAETGASTADIANWAARLPMIYRSVQGRHVPAPRCSFRDLLAGGFGDGRWPDLTDWMTHLSQVWPHVRTRQTLEIRTPDGQSWENLATVPAFWTGLTYDQMARRSALTLLSGITAEQLRTAIVDVAVRGLKAMVGDRSVGELAEELVKLSLRGLASRVAAGREPANVVELVLPLVDIVRTGVTPAEHCWTAWRGQLRERPEALVAAMRV